MKVKFCRVVIGKFISILYNKNNTKVPSLSSLIGILRIIPLETRKGQN